MRREVIEVSAVAYAIEDRGGGEPLRELFERRMARLDGLAVGLAGVRDDERMKWLVSFARYSTWRDLEALGVMRRGGGGVDA